MARTQEQKRAKDRAYYLKNRDAAIARARAWAVAHPDRAAAKIAAYQKAHPDRITTANAKWKAANPEQVSSVNHSRVLRKQYRMTPAEYASRLAAQGGACAICKRPETKAVRGRVVRMSVDHDHACCHGNRSCGKCVRALLCGSCNSVLGLMGDDPARLRAAAAYLETVANGPTLTIGTPIS